MKKLFILLALIVTSACFTPAQRITDVSALDPNNVTIFNTRPISELIPSQGPWNYIINVPQNVALFSFTINATPNTDIVNLNAACSYDSSTTDTAMLGLNPVYLPMAATNNGVITSGSGGVALNLVSSQPTSVVIGINDCQRLLLIFSGASGTTTNTIRAQGAFTPIQSAPFSFGGATTISGNVTVVGGSAPDTAASGNPVVVAGVDAAGNVQELPVADTGTAAPAQTVAIGGKDTNGNLDQLTVATNGIVQLGQDTGTGADTNNHLIQPQNQAGTNGVFQVLNSLLNNAGNGIDRAKEAGATGVAAVGGAAAAGSAASGNPIVIAGIDAAGNIQNLPVAVNGAAVTPNVAVIGGRDNGANARALAEDSSGELQIGFQQTGGDGVSNTSLQGFSIFGGTLGKIAPFYFNGTTWDRAITCSNTSTFSVASTTTQVIPLSGATKIRICSFDINPSTITAGSTDLVYGTGTNCATGLTTLTGAYTLPAAAVVDITPSTLGATSPLTTPAGQAVCVRATTSTVNGFIVWEQH